MSAIRFSDCLFTNASKNRLQQMLQPVNSLFCPQKMLVCDYIVEQIDGDYAHLKRVDQPEEELKVVARALLPAEIYEGCELHYELMQYSMK